MRAGEICPKKELNDGGKSGDQRKENGEAENQQRGFPGL
jgi:hypothetical protein